MGSRGYVEAEIYISGRVQGVGFRPFIYREAVKHGLRGYVINLGDAGVEVAAEGPEDEVESFLRDVKADAPQVSEIEGVRVGYKPYRGRFGDFRIDKSRNHGDTVSGVLPPDIGICPQCLEDMGNPRSRWFEYPFTACAWCGPRFTAISSLPYDRERTHMHRFPMCGECSREYHDPADRRFDAQGMTCSVCGPQMSLYDAKGSLVATVDAFEEAAERLLEGKILAVKGIGGIHLASIATDEGVVVELRRRKNRPSQPFALMAPDLEAIRGFADPTSEEVQALTSWRRPIVLIRKRGALIADGVAPGLAHVGVMLPYTGIHAMLFKRLEALALIMTSGNRAGMPMAITNESAMTDLKGIADYFLLHDRDIINRCDDSVLRINDGRRAFLRRSRGFVPDSVRIPMKTGIGFAVGTELANAAAVSVNGRCYQTQYLGDITNLESLEYEEKAIYSMRDLLKITRNPDVIGCDQHPGYMTSQLADMISQDTGAPVIKSQHHHAHVVSVCAEKGVAPDEPVIGVALDGAGYGTDGAIWGGEVLISTYSNFDRAGHLENIAMPGGDLCALYPYRFLISALTKVNLDDEEIRDITKNHVLKGLRYGENELEIVLKQARESSTIKTTSSGRFLDAVSALLELTYRRTYEGEPATRLESIAINGDPKKIDFKPEIVQKNGKYELLTANTLNYLSKNVNKYKKEDIAAFSQYYLAKGIADIVNRVAEEQKINNVALSGGVFANAAITKIIFDELETTLNVLYPSLTPVGDGGSAQGQLCIGLNSVM